MDLFSAPLAKETDKQVNFFEISGNRVIHLDNKSVSQQIKDLVGNLPNCVRPSYIPGLVDSYLYEFKEYQNCVETQVQQIKDFRAETKYYEIELVDLKSLSWRYNPKSSNNGESGIELNRSNSEYKNILSKLETDQDYVAFLVRPDSFATFRQAREIAWKAGFDVGWEPQTPETPIVFGSGGRTVGVQ